MAVLLFVAASMAVLAGLVGLVAGHVPRTTGRQQDPRAAAASWLRGNGLSRALTGVGVEVERR